MSAKNMQFSASSADEIMKSGFSPCQRCCSNVAKAEVTSVTPVANPSATSPQVTVPTIQPQIPVSGAGTYVLNTNSKKFHYPTCSSVGDMSPKNRSDVSMSRDEIIAQGFVPCKRCNP